MQGLRDPNSWIDANHPDGKLDARYFRGSGTSQAAAIASGAAALVLQKYPTMTPDCVKRYFQQNGLRLSGTEAAQGGGEMQLGVMLNVIPTLTYVQKLTLGVGNGSVERARGQDHISRDGVALTGEQDIFGKPINTTQLASGCRFAPKWPPARRAGRSASHRRHNRSGHTAGGLWLRSCRCGPGARRSGSTWSGQSWAGGGWG